MSFTLPETVSALAKLPAEELHKQNCEIRGRLAENEWQLAAHLIASDESQLYLKRGCASVVDYAQRCLNLSRQKAFELMRVGRIFALLPAISSAFREAKICWSKVREITRVATPDTEAYWLEQALLHDGDTVARMIAMSPKEYKRGKALAAATRSTQTELFAAAEEVHPAQESRLADAEQVLPKASVEGLSPASGTATVAAAPAPTPPPPAPEEPDWEPPQFVRVTLTMSTEEYSYLEKAVNLMMARAKKRCRREAALAEVCQAYVSTASSRSKPRYQVLVHVSAETGEGFVETDRGVLAASLEQVEEALKEGHVMVTGPEQEVEEDEQLSLLPPRSTSGGKREAIPTRVLRTLYMRAKGRCEKCGTRRGPLDAHHARPWSKGGRHRLEEMQLLCDPCHQGTHVEDIEKDPNWRAAREKAVGKRKSRGRAPET